MANSEWVLAGKTKLKGRKEEREVWLGLFSSLFLGKFLRESDQAVGSQ